MICYNRIAYSDGEIAQLARAIGSYPIGRGFDPLSRYHMNLNRQKYLFFCIKMSQSSYDVVEFYKVVNL